MARFRQKSLLTLEAECKKINMAPSDLVELYFKLPFKSNLEPFSFSGREYLKTVYDTSKNRVLLMFGRQCEKSTALGNIALAYSIAARYFKTLYVAPTFIQSSQFSNDRIKQPLLYSEQLQAFMQNELTDRVNHKTFLTGSEIRLRNAFLNADRIRGLQTDLLLIDEIQDVLTDLLPIIEETLFHSEYKLLRYSGTPKSEDNTLAHYWHNFSTQNEWVIPCDRHTPVYWNIVGENNIPTHAESGLVCERCRKSINARHEKAHWAAMNPTPSVSIPYEGYRVPQLITPMVDWHETLDKYKRYSRQRFFNEVLALPYDSGLRPISRADLRECCVPSATLTDSDSFEHNSQWAKALSQTVPTYMGIDWGTGEQSYTYVTIGAYIGSKIRIIYAHRFEGSETEPDRQLDIIRRLVGEFHINKIGADYGGGFDRNDKMVRWFGPQRIFKYQYANSNQKLHWDTKLGRFIARRSELMADIFTAIRRGGVFLFPRWEETEQGIGKELLNVYSEYNEARRMTVYNHPPGMPDDGCHSLIYMFLASCIEHPRPDILFPTKE